jgi:hypothetical protein
MADYNNSRDAKSSLSTPICSSLSGVKGGRGGPTWIGVIRFIAAFIAGTQPPVKDKIYLVTISSISVYPFNIQAQFLQCLSVSSLHSTPTQNIPIL